MTRVDRALSVFSQGFSCSQAVCSACCESLGLDARDGLKAAGAFGGGMGHTGGTCGAVTGALILIGLKYGKTKAEDMEAKERTYAAVKEFIRRFKARHGSINCGELLKYDISTDEGLQKAREEELFRSICPGFVRSAVEIVEEMLFA